MSELSVCDLQKLRMRGIIIHNGIDSIPVFYVWVPEGGTETAAPVWVTGENKEWRV